MIKDKSKIAKMVIDEVAIGEKLRKPVGRRVHFIYPKGEQPKSGILKDRCVVRSNAGYPDEVPYWDVIDLIQFDDEDSPWLRVGYYRMAKATPLWASQTTLTDRIETWEELMVKSAREMPWFRRLLERVMERAGNHEPATSSALGSTTNSPHDGVDTEDGL